MLSLAIYIHSKTLWSKGEFCWFIILFSWKRMRCDGCLDLAKLSRVNNGMLDRCILIAGVRYPKSNILFKLYLKEIKSMNKIVIFYIAFQFLPGKLLNFCNFRFYSWILHLNTRFTISFGCLWWLVFNGRWRRSGQVW